MWVGPARVQAIKRQRKNPILRMHNSLHEKQKQRLRRVMWMRQPPSARLLLFVAVIMACKRNVICGYCTPKSSRTKEQCQTQP